MKFPKNNKNKNKTPFLETRPKRDFLFVDIVIKRQILELLRDIWCERCAMGKVLCACCAICTFVEKTMQFLFIVYKKLWCAKAVIYMIKCLRNV